MTAVVGGDNGRIKETFEEYKRRTSGPRWAIRIEFALLHHPAYRSLSYGPALKVLAWCYEKGRDVKTNKKKRGNKRYVVTLAGFLFPYEEAAARGLTAKQFTRAIRELHAHGFIDVVHLGSGLRGNPNKYRLSERWRTFGTDSFQHVAFPENKDWARRFSVVVADGELRRHVPRDEATGKWTRRDEENTQRPKYAVVQQENNAVVNPDRRPISAVQQANFDENTTAVLPCNSSSTTGCTAFDADGLDRKVRKEGVAPQDVGQDRARGDDAGPSPSKTTSNPWRPPRSEMRENVIEILRTRPDPRATDKRFILSLVDQLQGVQRGRLDPFRVHRYLQAHHGLDDWTADLLFAIAVIDRPGYGEATH